MNDILFGNNNKAVIKMIADKSYKNQRQRNLFIILAITITTFMLVTTISMGLSYGETYTDNAAKAMGTAAHFAVTNSSIRQIENLKKQDIDIENVGTQVVAGSVTENAKLGLVWIDKTEWENHRVPTIDDIHGTYPTGKNEIMLSTWAMQSMGISEPTIGMSIPVTYRLNGELEDIVQNFTLSGYYTDYLQTRTGNRGTAYISDEFLQTVQDVEVAAMVSLQNPNDIDSVTEEIAKELNLRSNQEISVVPTLSQNETVTYIAIALIGLIVITAYLLIYNVLFISISKDIAHYGQLKTLGTTKRQIEKIIYTQVIKLSFIGIMAGLILGTLTSFAIVPLTMKFFFAGKIDVIISFSPYVYIGATAFTFVTVMLGSFKPARIAGKISPIEAAKYTDYKGKQKHSKKIRIFALSARNVFRNKKGAFYTFASLIFGLTTFMLVSVLTTSMNPKVMIENEGDADFTIQFLNNTSITENDIEIVASIDGIENFYITTKGEIELLYNDETFSNYIQSLGQEETIGFDYTDKEMLDFYTSNFYSNIYGIESAKIELLNQTLETPIDITAFENGEFVLLEYVPDLPNGEKVFNSGDIVTDTQNRYSFTIGNVFVDDEFNDLPDSKRSTAPNLYVSQTFLEQTDIETSISNIKFDTNGNDDLIAQELNSILGVNSDILIESRHSRIQEISEYVAIVEIVGTSVSIIFMLIGILNFVNTIAVSVTVRTHELALLESVGMTTKQVKKMLSLEGLFYFIIPFGFVLTLGNGLLYLIYEGLKENDLLSVFSYPTAIMMAVAILLFVICIYLPIFIYNLSLKGSIIKRLKVDAR